MLKMETTLKNTEKLRSFSLAGITMILSFVATGGELFSFTSPINVIIAALCDNYGIFSLAASLLSYIINGTVFDGIINLCSIATLIAIRLIANRSQGETHTVTALMAASSYLLYSAIISLVSNSELEAVLYRLLSAFLIFSITYSVKVCYEKYSNNGMFEMNGRIGVMIALIFVIAVSTLTSVSILGINFGRAVGVAVMLFAANKYKYIGGVIYGALCAVGVIICSPEMAKNTLLLAVAGLICGAFSSLGVVAVVISLIVSAVGGIFIMGTNADSFKLLADIIVGAVLYLCLPDNKILSAFRLVGGKHKSPELSCQTAASRLEFASKNVNVIRDQILSVTEALEKKIEPPDLSKEVRVCVCRDCSRFALCWEHNASSVKSAFLQLAMRANLNGAITLEDIRNKHGDCCKKEVLMSSYNMLYMSLQYEQDRKYKMSEMRELLCSQLKIMSQLFDDLSDDTRQLNKIDAMLSDSIADIVYRQGIKNAKICAYIDSSNRPKVEIYLPKSSKPDLVKLTVDIGEAACADFDLPVVSSAENMKKLEFTTRPYYSLEWDVLSTSAVFGDYSGDYYEFIKTSSNRQFIVLSDGMGTGKSARLDSMFTVNLVSRLLTGGASASTAAALINSVLRVKSWEESFATLDIADIDLSTGALSVLKCGAALSYLIRKGSVTVLDAKTFPLGILSGATPETVSIKLERDDILLICSDGISRREIENAVSSKKSVNKRTPKEIIRMITDEISVKKANAKPDDVTVIAVKIV